ncbi:hypothetical protein MS5797_53450 [Klebsiella pneumoniae]|nr:hypothetical protein MS5797_53450 [Klebsiella pneumoniae]
MLVSQMALQGNSATDIKAERSSSLHTLVSVRRETKVAQLKLKILPSRNFRLSQKSDLRGGKPAIDMIIALNT